MKVERRAVIDCLVFFTCTCQQPNWSGKDKEEKGVSHIGACSQGQFTSGSAKTSLPTPPPPHSQKKRPVLSSTGNDCT